MKVYLNLLYRKLVSIPEDIRDKPSIQIICSVKNYFHKMASVLIFFKKKMWNLTKEENLLYLI